ncbi:hypothetical protein [Aureibacillus halotolerans]|uniref:Uncharacterized protein n=1 Tax=Aureibacillus halotolerans TaxID=1508390 RepID=A0A4V3D591_9BACI|nr:hypothetical protein [Aureibacillus halotolerans]TDQ39157.1 hypothetical protein EV213_108104 [Aureibacillus halotolerans]
MDFRIDVVLMPFTVKRNQDRFVKILRFPRARLQLPRKAKAAFLRDLQLALFPQESTYFDYADVSA